MAAALAAVAVSAAAITGLSAAAANAAPGGAPTRASSCARPTTCSPRSASRHPSAPARELAATGEKARKRGVETVTLTAQEAYIARLARDGRTNPEIGAQLFLLPPARSNGTCAGYYTKLGIGSRRDLHSALVQLGRDGPPS